MKLIELLIYIVIGALGGFLGGTLSYLFWFNKPKMSRFDQKEIYKVIDELSKKHKDKLL